MIKSEGLSRVFGHLDLEVEEESGEVVSRFKVTHGIRFVELSVTGRRVWEVPYIASRICGACSIAHYLASIKAIENALKLSPSEWVEDFRDAINMIQIAQNHVVHLAFMALPDYLGVGDVNGLIKVAAPLMRKLMNLNALLLKSIRLTAGRIVNPNTLRVGGLASRIPNDVLLKAARHLSIAREFAEELVSMVSDFELPEASEPSGYCLALRPRTKYLTSSDEVGTCFGGFFRVYDYRKYIDEKPTTYSNSKEVLMKGKPVYVGPRARYSLYGRLLREYLNVTTAVDTSNPFSNVVIKAYEVLYCINAAEALLEDLTYRPYGNGVKAELKLSEPRTGVAAIEAPRGLLIHKYVVSPSGRVIDSDIVTPTEINSKHIEAASAIMVKSLMSNGVSYGELERRVTMLVRAYDPCLPCAVHLTVVKGGSND